METVVGLNRNERDWLLKRVLDAIADVKGNPSTPDADEPMLVFLEGLRDKLRP